MEELRVRLNQLGTTSRRNVSVPNPADQTKSSGKVSQAFVRDPDGYYIGGYQIAKMYFHFKFVSLCLYLCFRVLCLRGPGELSEGTHEEKQSGDVHSK